MELIYREVNGETGEVIERPYTKQELAEVEKNIKRLDAEKAEAETKVAEKQAIADRLGLTLDEIKLLLG